MLGILITLYQLRNVQLVYLMQHVQPSDKKVVDLPRLKEDIHKYKPWLSDTAAIWWDQLDLNSIYNQEVDSMEWILLDLQDGKTQ